MLTRRSRTAVRAYEFGGRHSLQPLLFSGFSPALAVKIIFKTIAFAFLAFASCAVAAVKTPDAVDFRTDVMAVLSKAGRNAGTCHGNAMGKGGFKLSLRGQDPDLDWLALAREQGGRRVNMLEPEQSLALRKALGAIAHEGGQRFDLAAPECDILLRWIRGGARDSGSGRKVVKLEVTPTEQVLIEPTSEVWLKAVATFSDGTVREVTRLAVFDRNNFGVKVSVDGNVTREHFALVIERDTEHHLRHVAEVARCVVVRHIHERDGAPLARCAAGDGEEIPLRMPRERADALGHSADAAHDFAGRGIAEQHFAIAADREPFSIAVESERRHRHRARVMRGRGAEESFAREFRERARGIAAVICRARI